jgi:hypothetical protein
MTVLIDWRIATMTRFLFWMTALFAASALAGCGGGASCEQTGPVEYVYAPAERVSNVPDALQYRLGQTNTWTLQVRGVSSECLTGLNVRVPVGRPPLPDGMTLEPGTGTIRTGLMTKHVEGFCNSSPSLPSTNRTCSAGAAYSDVRYVLHVTSDHIDKDVEPINTVITFKPAP